MLLPELTTWAATKSLGTAGTDLFYGPMHEEYPDAVTIIQEYGGLADEPSLGDPSGPGTKIRYEQPFVQFLFRGARDDYDGPRTRAEAGRVAVMTILNTTMSGVLYLGAEIVQPPFHMMTDENQRHYFVLNVHIFKEPS
jgi:hypothetical protein